MARAAATPIAADDTKGRGPRPAQWGMDTPYSPARRVGRVAGLLALSAALGLGALAQNAAPAPSPKAAPNARPAAANTATSLSAAERESLSALFQKVRPATLRIEQCLATKCDAPGDSDGTGSAVLISNDGLALTAYHVVEGARALSAQTLDKKRYSVQVIGYDDQNDLALLKVNVPSGTPYLPLAAERPKVGDPVLAVGNGLGRFLVSKTGRLTALDAKAPVATFAPNTLQLDAQLRPGDSGGPIVNRKGEVTGISSYIRVINVPDVVQKDAEPQYAAFAVPVTRDSAGVAALRRGEKLDAPIIGIGLGSLSELASIDADDFARLSKTVKLGDTPGAFFLTVAPGSPAARAGLVPLKVNDDYERVAGDLVTEVGGKRILNFSDFQYAVRTYRPGDTVTLTVLRDGKTLKVPVTLVGRSTLQN